MNCAVELKNRLAMKTNKLMTLLAIPAMLLLYPGCRKDNNNAAHPNTQMYMRMMDAPSPYAFSEVNVDVTGVEVNITSLENGQAAWYTLNAHAGVYNLLDLANGMDVLIGDAYVPPGMITQVRLKLGPNNTVTDISGHTQALTIPSGNESGLKINVHEQLVSGSPFTMYLDFDAAQSIHQTGNGTYIMNPVLRGFVTMNTGTVIGSVSVIATGIAVKLESVSNPNVVYMSYATNNSGRFMLRGIAQGKYTLKAYAADTDIPVVVSDVEVTEGNTTDVGLVVLAH